MCGNNPANTKVRGARQNEVLQNQSRVPLQPWRDPAGEEHPWPPLAVLTVRAGGRYISEAVSTHVYIYMTRSSLCLTLRHPELAPGAAPWTKHGCRETSVYGVFMGLQGVLCGVRPGLPHARNSQSQSVPAKSNRQEPLSVSTSIISGGFYS